MALCMALQPRALNLSTIPAVNPKFSRRRVRASRLRSEPEQAQSDEGPPPSSSPNQDSQPAQVSVKLDEETAKSASKLAKEVATKFAPRPSGAVGNPAFKGSWLYDLFGYQALASAVIGGLLSYNLIFPSEDPSIARLLGMWSVWMFTVPSLRARECTPGEKDALNILFLLIPVVNVALPFVWKSFAFVYTADVITMAGIYYWKLGGSSDSKDST